MIKIVNDEFENIEEIYKLDLDEDDWYVTPSRYYIKLEPECKIGHGTIFGNYCKIGCYCTLGDFCRIYDYSELGNYCYLGDGCVLGQHCKLGDNIQLDSYCKLKADTTSEQLAEIFRNMWRKCGEKIIFTKWVTKDRKSPMPPHDIPPLDYSVGKVICVEDAKKSDQQCAKGLHVFEYGHRPEWYGYYSANHTLIPIDVEVETKDILFGGLPFQRGKIRVRKLKVLS